MQKLQSKSHHQQTNTQLCLGWIPFLSPNNQSTKISHSLDLLTPSSSGVFQLVSDQQRLLVTLGEGCQTSRLPTDASTAVVNTNLTDMITGRLPGWMVDVDVHR